MSTQLSSAFVTAAMSAAAVVDRPTRLRDIFITSLGGAGNLVFRNGSATGAVKAKFAVTSTAGYGHMDLTELGLRFERSMWVETPADTAVTIFYD